MLGAIAYAPTRAEAERKGKEFEAWCHRHGYGKAAAAAGAGLGADGDLLPVPQGALAPPADHEGDRIALRCATVADGCGQAVQEG